MSTGTGTGTPITGGVLGAMLTEADILTRVNQITGRAESSITTYLQEVLEDISKRTFALEAEETGNTTAGQSYVDKPADMVGDMIASVVIDDEPIYPISWNEWTLDDEPGYCFRADRIYLRPTPDGATAYTVYYSRIHPDVTVEGILFPVTFRDVIIQGVSAKVYESYEITDKQAERMGLYEKGIFKLTNGVFLPESAPRSRVRM